MNRDDVTRMAREAAEKSNGDYTADVVWAEAFAHLIASHVAEECAKKADELDCAHKCMVGKEVGNAIRELYK